MMEGCFNGRLQFAFRAATTQVGIDIYLPWHDMTFFPPSPIKLVHNTRETMPSALCLQGLAARRAPGAKLQLIPKERPMRILMTKKIKK